ncbi:hypothetical protein EVAR_77494_1 [Eumeta japonica]|uniref:Peptidase A2 domain-containing protein n=1 Tax=Eumeta variegata TaxID=151549 RepID=A0A4C1T788_EUMVA|nr:hypothetical protein EVAR_77494_1 [Eumeta japonica]
MDSKRVTRAHKMNTAKQENETSMSASTSRSSETGTTPTHMWDHGTNENLSGGSPGQERIDEELNIDDSNRNVNTARQKKHAALLAQLEFEQLEGERIAARAAVARTKMLLLRLQADEEDSGDLIDCDNASHLSKTDKLEKQTVTLGDIEPAPESSPMTAPPPPPTACSEINSASLTASKETSKIVNEPSKTLADLPSFSGNVSEWIAFRSVYNDRSGLFSNVHNVARIRKALSGEARETCEALIYTETDPLQIMRVLERRFGRPDAIIKQELNKLRRMTPMNGGMGNISSFANKVNNCVAAIRTLNKLSYLSAPEMTDEIVDKFNDILKFKWCEYKDSQNNDEPELVMLSTFLNKIADQCSASMPIEKGGSRNSRPAPERRPQKTNTINTMKYDDNNSNSHTAFQPSNRSNVKMICPLCNNEHGLPDCGEFVKLKMSEEWDAAKRLRMCFRCLRGRHMQATCRGKPCKICQGGHHRLLHQERTTREGHEGSAQTTAVVIEHTAISVNNVNTMRAYLKIVPVELYGPEGSMKVHALLDEGSTVTLIDEQVANRIGAKGRRETLRVSSVGGNEITDERSRVIRVKIKGLFSRNLKLMTAQTIRNLKLAPQRVERATVAACSHLTDIAENLIYDAAAPCILIGQDNWGLIVSRQIKSGRANQPAASLT